MSCPRCGGPQVERSVRVRWELLAVLYLVGLALAYTLGGSLLHDLIDGNERSALPLWKAWVPLVGLLLPVAAGLLRLRRPVCHQCGVTPAWLFVPTGQSDTTSSESADSSRRAFLRIVGGVAAALAAAGGGVVAAITRNRGWFPVAQDIFFAKVQTHAKVDRPAWHDAHVKNYRRLGRTNVMVSDISLGSARIHDVAVARRAIERGITYFDTAPDYSDTRSEQVLGEAMKGQRDKVFLATKFCVADGHLPNDTPVPKVIEAVEASLRRLQTDHVDLIHIHACDSLDRLMAPHIHEAFARLKQQGKARFLGVSSHTPNLETIANAAIDSGRFDVMMLAYHFSMWPDFSHILEKAKAHDVGIVAMKTLKGAKQANLAAFRDAGTTYAQAAFRWVLSNPNVSCLVISISTMEQIDEYLYASGEKPRASDVAVLQRYDQLIAGDYCQPHCGACLSSCVHGLPINDVLRHRMYFKDYGSEAEAVGLYARLDRTAAACVGCPAPCANSCPLGVPIQEKMLDAHRLLSRRA